MSYQSIGKIHVRATLNPKFGEMWFYVSVPHNNSYGGKCLFDVLSQADVKYDAAKRIVQAVAKEWRYNDFFDVEPEEFRGGTLKEVEKRPAALAKKSGKSVSL